MSIIKHAKRKQNPFAQIERALLDSKELSWGAKGMLSYLLSKPENWTVRMTDLERRGTDGKYTVKRYMKELIEAGYVVRQHARGEGGKLAGVEFIVHESPVDREPTSPTVDSTDRGLYRQSVKQPLSNKEYSSNKDLLSKKDSSSPRKRGLLQPRLTEEQFTALKNDLRPDLPDRLKDGQSLCGKWLRMNAPANQTEGSARRFLELERPEPLTRQEKVKLKADEDEAAIEECNREAGYRVWSGDEARRKLRQFRDGEIPHYSQLNSQLVLAGDIDEDTVPF